MSHALSIMNPFFMLVCCAALAQNERAVMPVRLPGTSLDTSLRNEADRAIRQSVRWLARSPAGGWRLGRDEPCWGDRARGDGARRRILPRR